MKEFIDKLIRRFEEEHERCINRYGIVGGNEPAMEVKQCMEIVNQLAEEYKISFMQELVEARKNCSEDSDCSQCLFGQIEDRCILAELQIDADIKKNNGWISCSERLPERNKNVLCWAKSTARGGDACFVGSCENGFWFLQTAVDTLSYPTQYEVVAWCELPAPYTEGE